MSLDWQAAAARRMRRLVVALVVLVVLLVVAVVMLVLRPGGTAGPPVATGSPSVSTPARTGPIPEPSTTFTPDPTFIAPTRWVRLPKSTSTRLGLPTGYEHTPQGAAAAAVASAQYSTTFDFDIADRAAQVYALPVDRDAQRASLKNTITNYRAGAGLPTTGPVPAGVTVVYTPIGVNWTIVDGDNVEVSVLDRVTVTLPGKDPKLTLHSTPVRMMWVDGDWHYKSHPASDNVKVLPAVDIGSTAFNDAGWTAIQQGSAG